VPAEGHFEWWVGTSSADIAVRISVNG
jgi:hypothetical protein